MGYNCASLSLGLVYGPVCQSGTRLSWHWPLNHLSENKAGLTDIKVKSSIVSKCNDVLT
jgi:hypothetical protein